MSMGKNFLRNTKAFLVFCLTSLLVPQVSHAHIIGGNGFTNGFFHPLVGLDHLLVMIAIGIIGTKLGASSKWTLPSVFITFMSVGGFLAVSKLNLPFVEFGIALSVILFGVAILFTPKLPLKSTIAIAAFFALLHGHSHGQEMSIVSNFALYSLGFILSTALLHMLGITLGLLGRQNNLFSKTLRFSGVAISLLGVFFLSIV